MKHAFYLNIYLFSFLPLLLFGSIPLNFQTLIDLESLEKSPDKLEEALTKWNNQTVEVRGFVYQNDDNEWILSCDPNVPSCCRKSDSLCRKIFLTGASFQPDLSRLAVVEGVFTVEEVKSDEGKPAKLLHLENPEIKEEAHSSLALILALLGGAILIVYLFLRRRNL